MNRKERRRAAKEATRRDAGLRPGAAAPDPARLLATAVAAHRQGRLDEAESLYRRLIELRPGEPDAIHFLGLIAHQRGQSERAIELIGKAIAIDDRVAGYHSNLGEACRAAGRLDEAARHYRRALELQPGLLAARFGLGVALLGLGTFDEAARELDTVVRAEPADAEARLNLGYALAALGRADEAIGHYQAAIRAAPAAPDAHFALGHALEARGELRAAVGSLLRAVELAPGRADARLRLGEVLAALERYDEATQVLRDAAALDPDSAAIALALARVLSQRGEYGEAIRWFERADELEPGAVEPLIGIANAYHGMDRADDARRWFERALERDPASAEARYQYGHALQERGRFDEARRWYEQAVALAPDHAAALYQLALSRRGGSRDERLHDIERALAMPSLPDEHRIGLLFARAKIHDDVGEYDLAFGDFEQANALKNARLRYDPDGFTSYVDRVIASFPRELFDRLGRIGSESALPVFILGMPRSGTTLVEQILASHPDVYGAGELDYLRQIVVAMPSALGTEQPYPECIGRLDRTSAQRIAEGHLARLKGLSAQALRITDKLPDNFPRIGAIALLFPNASIIHTMRDPLDTCLSCYFQEFAHGHPYSYDLGNLGRFYRDYERLMAHWRAVLLTPMLEVPYEALVADQETWSRRLVGHVGLPWDDRCLAFHETERQVRTASFWQVRQPLYASSIGRWRAYARHLGPLFDALGIAPPA